MSSLQVSLPGGPRKQILRCAENDIFSVLSCFLPFVLSGAARIKRGDRLGEAFAAIITHLEANLIGKCFAPTPNTRFLVSTCFRDENSLPWLAARPGTGYNGDMRKLVPFLVVCVLIPLAGCRPIGEAYSSLQYHNIKWRIAKTKMTITMGDGRTDARELMNREIYTGSVKRGRVTVYYPAGFEQAASELAARFDDFYPVVNEKLGIDWGFDLILKLVRVDFPTGGFRYSTKLPRNRKLVFPVLMGPDGAEGAWTPIIAHEITEASLIAPKNRSQLALDDLYGGPVCIPTGTRWFRDGAADYAEHLFDGNPPPNVYAQLNRVRERLLSWSNCPDQPDWYDAAAGVLFEMKNRFGDDAVARMMRGLSKEKAPDGRGLARAFKSATGTDIETFLMDYETPWAGWTVRDTHPDPSRPNGALPGSEVRVERVYPATPAKRRGIETGDVIASFAGQSVASSGQLAHLLALRKPWEMVPIEVMRGGHILAMRIKLIPMPTNMQTFQTLSEIAEKHEVFRDNSSSPTPRN